MMRGCAFVAAMAVWSWGYSGMEEVPKKQIPITVAMQPRAGGYEQGKPILVTVNLTNGLPKSIGFPTYALKPNGWGGETVGLSLVDIYRNSVKNNLLLARPTAEPPYLVSGMGCEVVGPDKTLTIVTDLSQWKLRDGWLPGNYEITVRVDHIVVDSYTTVSTLSDPVRLTIR